MEHGSGAGAFSQAATSGHAVIDGGRHDDGAAGPAPRPAPDQWAVVALLAHLRRAFLLRPADVVAAAITGAAYYFGAELAFSVGTLSNLFAPLWPPNAILLTALLRAPPGAWWLYVAMALPAHVVAETRMGMPMDECLGAFLCNLGLALGAALALRLTVRRPPWLGTLRSAWITLAVVAVAAPGVVALTVALFSLLSHGIIGTGAFAKRWFVANLSTGLTLAPMLITWIADGFGWRHAPLRRWAEAAVVFAGLAVSSYLAFVLGQGTWHFPAYSCLFVPLTLWAAVRFGPQGASGAIFVIAVMAINGAMQGRGPFLPGAPKEIVFSLQIFLAVMSVPFLILAAAIDDRRRATAEALLTEQKLQSILDNTPASIYARDLAGRYILANRRARAMTKLPPDFLGKTVHEVLPEPLAAEFALHDRLALSSDQPITREIRIANGSADRVLLSTKFALHDGDGRAYGVCGISTDITDSKRSLEALKASEARFRAMAETVPAVLFTADRHGRLDYVNRRFFDVTGLPSISTTTTLVRMHIIHPADLKRFAVAWRRANARVEPFEQEVRLRTKQGSYSCFVVRARPIRDERGRIKQWVGAAAEIEELKEAERQLRASNARLTGILASISDFYYTLDAELRITAMNRQMASFVGMDVSQALGRNIFEVFPQLEAAKLGNAHRQALAKRTAVHLECAAAIAPDRWLEVNIYPFDGGLTVFSRDITERRCAQRALNDLSGSLLRSQDEERRRIARELHDGTAQNMAAVALNLRRLRDRPAAASREQIAESVELVDNSLSELRTISYLLHPPLLDEVGLSSALRWYVDGFEKRSHIKVRLEMAGDVGRLASDVETALFRIVQESLINVHRHSRSETAAIEVRRAIGEIVLTVTDQGRGMPSNGSAISAQDVHSLGVGIPGMSARMRQLGGRLDIISSKRGTTVQAIVPDDAA